MGTRIQRARADVLVAVGLLAVVALAMAAPRLQDHHLAAQPTPESALGPDGCPVPSTSPEPDTPRDRSGRFVPTGATSITLCRLVTDDTGSARTQSRVLTSYVDVMVDHLNAMPSIGRLKWIGQGSGVVGRPQPRADQFSCTDRRRTTGLSFVLTYPDRDPVVVWLDRNCGSATYNGRTRYGLREALALFYQLLRTHLADLADHKDVRSPVCAPRLPATELNRALPGGQGRDDIAANRAETDPLLPTPIVAATACRYAVSDSGARLVASRALAPASLDPLAQRINALFDEDGERKFTSCGEAQGTAPTVLDQLLVVDETSATAEIRVVREPCTSAMVAHEYAVVPAPELTAALDATLGPVSPVRRDRS